jgi:hypothetical protein
MHDMQSLDKARRRLVQIASLAVAAVESLDRRHRLSAAPESQKEPVQEEPVQTEPSGHRPKSEFVPALRLINHTHALACHLKDSLDFVDFSKTPELLSLLVWHLNALCIKRLGSSCLETLSYFEVDEILKFHPSRFEDDPYWPHDEEYIPNKPYGIDWSCTPEEVKIINSVCRSIKNINFSDCPSVEDKMFSDILKEREELDLERRICNARMLFESDEEFNEFMYYFNMTAV